MPAAEIASRFRPGPCGPAVVAGSGDMAFLRG
jgi:hypothetical protein